MSVVKWPDYSGKAARHSLFSTFLGLILALAVLLGVVHEMRLAGEIAIVVIRYTKHEVAQLLNVWGRLKRELTDHRPPRNSRMVGPTERAP